MACLRPQPVSCTPRKINEQVNVSEKPPIIPGEPAKEIPIEVLPPEAPEPEANQAAPGKGTPSPMRFRLALALAMLVDAVQIGLFPLFVPGFTSVANVAVDSAAFLCFLLLIGWHPALLPGFILEQVPLLGLVPTWTVAVWLAARRHLRPEDLPPSPKPFSSGPQA